MKTGFNYPYPELPEVLEEFKSEVRKILADNLVGIYLVGSIVTGDFDLDSDIDFLVVIKHELNNKDVENLKKMHRRIYEQDCYPAKHLEGSYIRMDLLCNAETMIKEKIWYLDNGSKTLVLSNHDNRWHVHWVLREKGIPLLGPEPKSFIKAIPTNALKEDVLIVLNLIVKGFQQELHQPLAFYNSRFGQSFVILTACRILHTLSTGMIESKKAGAEWGKVFLNNKWIDLIENAWQERKGVRFCTKIKERANQDLLETTSEFLNFAQKETAPIRSKL